MLKTFTCALLALTLGLGSCVVPSAALTPKLVRLEPDGSFGGSAPGVSSTNELEALGISEEDETLAVGAELKWAGARLALATVDTSYEGSGTATVDIDFGGTPISASTPVFTRMDLALHSARLTWDLLPTSQADLGIGVGVAVIDFDASVSSIPPAITLRTDELLPVPLVAGHVGTRWGDLALAGDVGLFEVEFGDESARVVDVDVGLSWRFLDLPGRLGGALVLGWRLIDVDAEYEEGPSVIELDMELSGPYLGLTISI